MEIRSAIGGLSGAAAWNATLAWLGGGPLAAGGGGMALGTLVIGGIAVGPALMIGGFVLEGEKALTEAHRYAAQVNAETAKLDVFEDFLGQVQRQIIELRDLVNGLKAKAAGSLIELESRVFVHIGMLIKDEEKLDIGSIDFNPEKDAAKFQKSPFWLRQ